jgi:hypothetical protein
MEDWLENNHYLFSTNKDKQTKYIYASNEIISCIILDKYKALEFSKKNKCKVFIYIENEDNIYQQTGHYYLDGLLYKT